MPELVEREFIFTVTCGRNPGLECPGGDALRDFKNKIDSCKDPDRDARRAKIRDKIGEPRLLEIGYYTMHNVGYTRDLFFGLARAKVFMPVAANRFEVIPLETDPQSPGYQELQKLFLKIFADVDLQLDPQGNIIDWLTWTVVPLPDGGLGDFEFTPMGGSGRG